MYLASLINKGREVYANGTTDPTALPAETILRMVTVNGAKSVLWDDELGSLEVGKKVGIGSDYLNNCDPNLCLPIELRKEEEKSRITPYKNPAGLDRKSVV